MDLIRLNVLPPISLHSGYGRPPQSGQIGVDLATLMIATPATRIVKCTSASPWEVFLCPQQAGRLAIHYRPPRRRKTI